MPGSIVSDIRMLELMEILKETEEIRFDQEFYDAIGFSKQNIRNVRLGLQHFTIEHITKACLVYGCNANWILNLERQPVRIRFKKMPLPGSLPKSREKERF